VFVPLIQSIFHQSVRLTIFYIFLSSHFVTVAIDNVQQQIRGYDSLHGYPGTHSPCYVHLGHSALHP
jgi:hypothetical protein